MLKETDPDLIPKLTSIPYVSHLEFESYSLYRKIVKKTERLHRKHTIGKDRLWFSAYFQKDLISNQFPKVSLRYIDDEIGWGVFAEKDFSSMELIGEYSGLVRKRRSDDHQNSYCFEYLIVPGHEAEYLIDAQDQGGISRYVNHSYEPNLSSSLIVYQGVCHIVLFTNKSVKKGEELCYDYGREFWKKRKKPR